MENTPKKEDWEKEVAQEKTPDIVKEEPNDKPAGRNVQWTIFIAVAILLIIYLVFFYLPGQPE